MVAYASAGVGRAVAHDCARHAIYQPAAIARRIFRAAHDAPRQLWIGASAGKAIIGNMLIPGWVDGSLTRHGYRGEITSVKTQTNCPDNLYDPVDTDPGAHGRLDAHATSPVAAADPRWLKLGIAAALGVVAGTMLFATEAHGRSEGRTAARNRRRTPVRARLVG